MDEKTGGTVTLDRPRAPDVHALRVSVTRGPDRGAGVVVDRRGVIVGRAPGAGLRLTDAAVSSFHVELTARHEGLVVRDLASHNGTFYAGARLSEAVVPPGAALEVGASVLQVELAAHLAPPEEELASFGPLRGASAFMRTAFALLARLAPTDLTVLFEGPAGTGKGLAARAVHEASRRADGPFVVFDCASVPAALAAAVLFGQDETAGREAVPGAFEAAEDGSLLVAHASELPLELQVRLLAVLETREVPSAGGTRSRPLRSRVMASSRRDLRAMVNATTFREDLYIRLAQARVALEPLAQRSDDVTPLTYHFLQSLPPDVEGARTIAREALEELKRREYRANVRELKSTVERASLLARGPTITAGDLAFERLLSTERERGGGPDLAEIAPFKEAKRTLVDDFERDYLKALLLRAGDNLSRASAVSGIERHHLRDLLRKHALYDK